MYSLYEVEQILRNKQVFVCSLAFLGEGEHSEAFLVNRDIVVKLPKHRQASECLKTEMQVVKGLDKAECRNTQCPVSRRLLSRR